MAPLQRIFLLGSLLAMGLNHMNMALLMQLQKAEHWLMDCQAVML